MEFSTADTTNDLEVVTRMPPPEEISLDDEVDDEAWDETVNRVVPADGTRLLVAASFNSAI